MEDDDGVDVKYSRSDSASSSDNDSDECTENKKANASEDAVDNTEWKIPPRVVMDALDVYGR